MGKPISVCGDMATQRQLAVLLVGLGIRELSVPPVALPLVKATLREISAQDAARIAAEALKLDTANEVELLLHEMLPLMRD